MKHTLLSLAIGFFLVGTAYSADFYPATKLTGNVTGSLDKLDGDTLSGGDVAIVVVEEDEVHPNGTYYFVLDAANSSDTSPPHLIAPATNPGTKRWTRLPTALFDADIPGTIARTSELHTAVTLSAGIDSNLLSLSTQELGLDTQTANYVFAGPTTGDPAAPSFRLLVSTDIPDLSSVYQPLDTELTALAGLTSADGKIPYFTGSGTASLVDLSSLATLADNQTFAGDMTFSGSTLFSGPVVFADDVELPSSIPLISPDRLVIASGTTLPETCSTGEVYWDTDEDTDGALYTCKTTDTWKKVESTSGIATTDINTSAKLYAIVTDETGSGTGSPLLVFNQGPTINGATLTGTITATSANLNLPSANADPGTTAGRILHDTNITGVGGGGIKWFDGTTVRMLVDLDADPSNDGYVVGYNAGAGKFAMVSNAPMVYPDAGIAVSTGSAWTTSKTAPDGDILGTSDAQQISNKTFGTGMTWPTFNQNTTGTSAGLAAQYIDWNSTSGGKSIANKPSISGLSTSGITGTLVLSKDGSTTRTVTFPDATGTVALLSSNISGTAGGLTSQYIDWNASSGGTSIANKPTIGDNIGNLVAWEDVGSCSDPGYATEAACEGAAGTWTPAVGLSIGTFNPDTVAGYKVGGLSLILDTAGDGATTHVWSADKIVDQLALKQGALTNSAGLAAALSDETGAVSGTPKAVFSVEPTLESPTVTGNFYLETNGASISANNGTITFAGNGDGYDENFSINLNAVENTIVLGSPSSGATLISTSLGLASSGAVDFGGATSLEIPSGATLPATCATGDIFWDTDADTDGSLYVCRTANTWKEVDDDGGAGGMENTDIDTSAELRAILTDETGTGALVFAGGDIGAATATTASAGDNDTSVATTAFVNTAARESRSGTHASPSTTNPLSVTWNTPMHTVYYGATGEIDLPAASGYPGRGILIYNTGAFTITVDPNSSEVIVRDGTVQTGGVSMTLSSGAGNFVAMLCDGTRWITLGYKGTLAAGS